ncbi:hypothetical protein ACHHYP_20777 [Achlya hypogyna]|uniref:Peptidase S54 rhomboid domain-containing protein n=1 Tax=Achlya hypogyna TaxID=1202772 RepID=A0A1V9YAB7_ACHHY|nr:hypothetical protein ACHHYP_20777 [Achlya hypogyna]
MIGTLLIVLNQNSPADTLFMGFTIPTKYAAWAELVYLHYFVPQSSFVGHLSGILAGYLYMHSPLWHLNLFSTPRRYAYRSGTSGYRSSGHSTEEDDAAFARRLQEEEFRRR